MRGTRSAALLATGVLLISGSAVGAQTAGDIPCGDVQKLGYSPLTMEFDYFRFTAQGIREVTDGCGIELVIDDPGFDAGNQVSGIENLIAAGVGGVGIVSVDPVAVRTAVEAAREAGIPVVSQVSTFEGADVYVGLPEHEFGRLQGQLNGQALLEFKPDTETYKVAILNADSLGEGLLDRKQGLIDGLSESVTNYEIVSDVEAWAEDTALTAVETILQANPDLDLIMTVNDPGSLGARSAVQASGIPLNTGVIVGGLGIDKRVLEGVLAGDFPGTVSPEPVATGRTMAELMLRVLAGETVEQQVDVPPAQITTENAQAYIDLLYPTE
jgi:ABC-type sugar transport system substrate-binding protein